MTPETSDRRGSLNSILILHCGGNEHITPESTHWDWVIASDRAPYFRLGPPDGLSRPVALSIPTHPGFPIEEMR